MQSRGCHLQKGICRGASPTDNFVKKENQTPKKSVFQNGLATAAVFQSVCLSSPGFFPPFLLKKAFETLKDIAKILPLTVPNQTGGLLLAKRKILFMTLFRR